MGRRMITLLVAVLSFTCFRCVAQTVSISTNMLDYAMLGTLNVDASVSVARRWSVTAGAKYNPFTYRKADPDRQFQYRQQSYAAGFRVWPWHTLSGWWLSGKLRYQEYNMGGIFSRETEEGDRFGTGFYAGYTHMLAPHLNLEFGFGFWTGLSVFRRYDCQVCGVTMDRGRKFFVLPDDLMISIAYVF